MLDALWTALSDFSTVNTVDLYQAKFVQSVHTIYANDSFRDTSIFFLQLTEMSCNLSFKDTLTEH